MAQFGQLVHVLAAGILDSTGTPVASGFARFYDPGTTNAQSVYSDATCTTPVSQPVTLSAGGTVKLYTLLPLRLIVKKSDDATQVLDANINYVDATTVSIKNSAWQSGVEGTLDTFVTSAAASSIYQESAGATSRTLSAWLAEDHVSVMDYGALGDGTTDDSVAIQAAIDRCATTGKRLYFPYGTYKVTASLNVNSITTHGFDIFGAGVKNSIIKQYGASSDTLVFSQSIATDYPFTVRDLGITANTVSSGSAVKTTNCNNLRCLGVETALHHKGFNSFAATGCIFERCSVLSHDSVSGARGFHAGQGDQIKGCVITANGTATTIGILSAFTGTIARDCTLTGWGTGVDFAASAHSLVANCAITGTTNANTGIFTGQYGVARDCAVTAYLTASVTAGSGASFSKIVDCDLSGATTVGIAITGVNVIVRGGRVSTGSGGTAISAGAARGRISGVDVIGSSSATGVYVNGANVSVLDCDITGFTTGISVAAVAGSRVVGNHLATNTTDVLIDSLATAFVEHSNVYTTLTDAALLWQNGMSSRRLKPTINRSATTSITPTYTPTVGLGTPHINIFRSVYSSGATTATIAATATTGLAVGDLLHVELINFGAGNLTVALNAQYLFDNGLAMAGSGIPAVIPSGDGISFLFRWGTESSTAWHCIQMHRSVGVGTD